MINCNKKHKSSGYCSMHHQRYYRYGDPNFITPESVRVVNNRSAQPRLRNAKKTSYLKLYGRHEHRVVAENKIGRSLNAGEIVHHIDGDRHNNSPENLQVMNQSDHIKHHRDEMQCLKNKKRELIK